MPRTRTSTYSNPSKSNPSKSNNTSRSVSVKSTPNPVSTTVSNQSIPQTQQKSSVITDIVSTAAGVTVGNVVGNLMTNMILGRSKTEPSSTVINQNQSKCFELFQKYESCITSEFDKNCKSLLDELKKCYSS